MSSKSGMFLLASVAGVLLLLSTSQTASAHPLGNFTVNRYAELVVQPKRIAIEYVVDMAEIPTYQEITQVIDRNQDGTTDEGENAAYRGAKCAEIVDHLSFERDGRPLAVALDSTALEYPPGAGGLPTLRLTCEYHAGLDAAASDSIAFRDSNFQDRIGWREIVVRGDGTEISDSNAPVASISDKLRSYPNDLINNPPRQTAAQFSVSFGAASPISNAPALNSSNVLDRTKDSFAALITVDDLTWQIILLSLVLAVGLGALHAVSPGHGKTIMAAYLVGTRGTVAQALLLGLTVTITHTTGVLVLGFITLFASRYILPESLYPFLSLASGVLAIAMGLGLAYNRWRMLQHLRHAGHHHAHDEQGEYSHSHQDEEVLLHGHSHLPAGAAEQGLTWKSLVGLGLAGGLVPSTSALILLLSAISLQRIPFGIVLIVAFGLGMAIVLVGAGIALVRAATFLERGRAPLRMIRLMPLLSAVVVIGAGIVVSVGALAQMGWRP